MGTSSGRYRSGRRRVGRRENQQTDAVVVALTAQVLLCILILLAAHLMKKADGERYGQVKDQYDIMVGDRSQTQQAAEYFTQPDGLSRFFAALEEMIVSFMGQFSASSEPNAIVPEDEAQAEEEPAEASRFQYDYLHQGELLRSGDAPGQGGLFPIDAGKNKDELEAPEGSVLSPVVITGKMKPPLAGLVTSQFAYRYHPITGSGDFHTGMDIAAPEGTPIVSALPGRIVEVGESEIYGNYVVVEHGDNLQTSYSHCSVILVREGMQVRRGERIARVGETGMATGPHLHFSVLVDGQFTNPYWVLQDDIQLVEQA